MFAGGMLVVLWLAFPSKDLAARLASAPRSDLLTIAYLKAWLAAKPDDWPIYLSLARHNLLLGRYDSALVALRRIRAPQGSTLDNDAAQMRLLVLERQAYALPEGSPERRALLAQVALELARLAEQPASLPELLALMQRAVSIGDMVLARQILNQVLARRNDRQDARWFAGMAQQASTLGDLALSADTYWRAFDAARTVRDRREYLMAAGRALQSADRLVDFFEPLELRLELAQPDRALYEFLIRLALAANKLELADRYARAMLKFSLLEQLRAWLAQSAPDTEIMLADGTRITADLGSLRLVRNEPVGGAPANALPDRTVGDRPLPTLPFDNAAYQLAYEVFLANSKQRDAYKVAESAVRQAPTSLVWRKRLAQIAEWTQRPIVALQQWRYLAQYGDDDAAWQQVQRLAVALSDQDALLELARRDALSHPGDVQKALQVSARLEAMGKPDNALAWLEQRAAAADAAARKPLIEAMVVLAERIGDESLLLKLLGQIDELEGPDPARAIRIATLLYARRNFRDAFAVLQAVRERAVPLDEFSADDEQRLHFWARYAELARRLQKDDDAWFGYRQMLTRNAVDRDSLDELSILLEFRSTRAAAAVAEFAYRRFGQPAQLERLISLTLEIGDFDSVQALLGRLDPKDAASLQANPSLVRMRAQYYQSQGKFDLARRDYDAALTASPEDNDLRAAMIWLLLAQRDAASLKTVLRKWADAAEREPALWGPFGAAWQALSEPQVALPYFHKQARQRNDYLWWLAYADALSENGLPDAAWSLRRKAWTELRRASAEPSPRQADARERVVALAMQFAPGDTSRQLLESLLRDRPLGRNLPGDAPLRNESTPLRNENTPLRFGPGADPPAQDDRAGWPADRTASVLDTGKDLLTVIERLLQGSASPRLDPKSDPKSDPKIDLQADLKTDLKIQPRADPPADAGPLADDGPSTPEQMQAAARELALSYLLTGESYDTARAWLLSRYANELAQPAWARLALALVQKDHTRIGRLLDDLPDWLPKIEQVEGMQETRRLAAAQSLAFDTLEARPTSNEAHQKLMDTIASEAPEVKFRALQGYQGALDYSGLQAETSMRLGRQVQVSLLADHNRLSSNDSSLLVNVPQTDRTVGVSGRWKRDDSSWLASLTRRSAVRDFSAARLDWQQTFEGSLILSAALGAHQPALELPAMRVGGMKDLLEGRATYNLTQRDYVGGQLGWQRFRSQAGTELGSGRTVNLEAGHRLRLEYPDVTLRVSFTHAGYSSTGNIDSIVSSLTPAGIVNPLDLFIPQGSNQVNLSVSVGESVRSAYSKSPRPFGEVGVRTNTITGAGYNARAGITASVLGADRLSMYVEAISATPGNTRGAREIGLSYQWLF